MKISSFLRQHSLEPWQWHRGAFVCVGNTLDMSGFESTKTKVLLDGQGPLPGILCLKCAHSAGHIYYIFELFRGKTPMYSLISAPKVQSGGCKSQMHNTMI